MHGGAAGLIFGAVAATVASHGSGRVADGLLDMCTTMALGPVARLGHWE